MNNALKILECYLPFYRFPVWVCDEWDSHKFKSTVVYYNNGDALTDVYNLVEKREPTNISLNRLYNKNKLNQYFGWDVGAYSLSTKDKLMPNIAIYCHATLKTKTRGYINVHVINLIGLAFDHPEQPDYTHFKNKSIDDIIKSYKNMWLLALNAVKHNNLKKLHIYNVGGGNFAGHHKATFIEKIFEPSFLPLLKKFDDIEILGYDFEHKKFNGGHIPNIFENPHQDTINTMYVNAWDPWSMIGNGNGGDPSLDGYWGRSTNMAVLGWNKTNPYIKFQCVIGELD